MNKSFSLLSLFTIGILTFSSCDETSGNKILPRHSGEYGEVLLVMDEGQWLGQEGDSLRIVMEQFEPQRPQTESMFSLLQFSPAEMSSLLRQHRNIIEIEKDVILTAF